MNADQIRRKVLHDNVQRESFRYLMDAGWIEYTQDVFIHPRNPYSDFNVFGAALNQHLHDNGLNVLPTGGLEKDQSGFEPFTK